MTFLGKVHFAPNVPDQLKGITDLARNLWWTWNPRARELFRLIDLQTWISSKGNAVRFLRNVSQEKLDRAAKDKMILGQYKEVYGYFQEYMDGKNSWWGKTYRDNKEHEKTQIAYFSAEYGLHEILQTYSGGLGVLSGDHCKSASDLGLPMISIGLIYRDGYFQQQIDQAGQQVPTYQRQTWEELPVNEVRDREGREIKIRVDLAGRSVAAKVWVINVGRVPIYMLDTDVAENDEYDGARQLTSRLYGGDTEMRIQQEILLGMGGVKAIRALRDAGILKLEPTIYHMNEGHSAFLSLERLRRFLTEEKLSPIEAREIIRSTSLFTTHTPVPAGHDRFTIGLVDKYFRNYYESLQISRSEFLDFGIEPMPDGQQLFSMTILALHFAAMANGVSKLHGEVSKKMMAPYWRDVPASETPIDYVTNGVHTRTWMSFDMQNLFDKYLSYKWRESITDTKMWATAVDTIPDAELWDTMHKMKGDLLRFLQDRLRIQYARQGVLPDELERITALFNANTLTVGFARRFATYKRATLLFRDPARLSAIVNNPTRPVQLLFSGKAHPADVPGQAFIKRLVEFSKSPEFKNRIVFLENYDMNIGRRLTSGVDVWLNNPRRPYEASGTSGMKVPLNGGLNCSILDGWWPEAMKLSPDVGWAIGSEKEYTSEDQQDAEDADSLYRILEKEIAPLFYENRNEAGVPTAWIQRVKEAMKICGPQFSTDRMVTDYAEKFYLRGSLRATQLYANSYAEAKASAKRKEDLARAWGQIRVNAEMAEKATPGSDLVNKLVKQPLKVRADVFLGSIKQDDVLVEVYAEELKVIGDALPKFQRIPMKFLKKIEVDGLVMLRYEVDVMMSESGDHGFAVRVIPNDPKAYNPMETGLVRWAQTRELTNA